MTNKNKGAVEGLFQIHITARQVFLVLIRRQVYPQELALIIPLSPPGHYRQMIALERIHQVDVVSQHRLCRIETISLASQILTTKLHLMTMAILSVYKNIRQPFSVLFVQRDLLALIIYALICGLTRMSGLSCAQYVGKHLHDSMTESVMKDSIREKRNLFAKES